MAQVPKPTPSSVSKTMREAGDERGEWAWMGIFDAVLWLEATKPADGEPTH